ncbi:MAG: response regulator [Synechococcaceae cyanobacterium RL_1_2]|nr:response regulator [Synechococcaceae cyanobacterium RL_1_2]
MSNEQILGKVLIVDDNQTSIQLLNELLQHHCYETDTATNGKSVLRKVLFNEPELILLDVMMPHMDGFEVCSILKGNEKTQEIPIIFMTALDEPAHKVRGLSLGAVDYITKPFQKAEVLARIHTHISLYRLNQEIKQQSLALTQALAEKDRAFEELQRTQMQLIQQEKMSALGQLVSGLAHEINNAIGIIHSNIPHISSYTEDLLTLVASYQTSYPHPNPQITAILKELELEFVEEDLRRILDSMDKGSDRIQHIMGALKSFSHLDEVGIKSVDLCQGMDITLEILQSRLINADQQQPAIKIDKHYESIPLVRCDPADLNQVFMHLLNNAIDAIERRYHHQLQTRETIYPGKIKITIAHRKEYVTINIEDNGDGIKQEHQQKLYDPFFSTKQIGTGKGLGLAATHWLIVNKHRGKSLVIPPRVKPLTLR